MNHETINFTKEGLKLERTFNAPRELVWRAWTEPEHMKKWWGPKGFTAPVVRIDLRVGGKYLSCMKQISDGKEFWSTGTYQEITPIEKLVMTDSFADAEGNIVPSSYYGMPGMALEMMVTVTLDDLGDKTKVTILHDGLPNNEHAEMTREGWMSSLDKMEESLRS